MYTLAVDRTNEKVRHLYKPCHPAILRSISRVAFQALMDGTDVSVCGEAASEPGILRFLLGLGIRKISADPLNIPAVKRMIGAVSIDECREFSAKSLKTETLEEAEKLFLQFEN
jgi:phosphoenolpyruvate-protein kinase (PTS system EI component)